ncbi:MAG: ABC transporter substrate-binding protein [Solirubrobacterales bacterium]
MSNKMRLLIGGLLALVISMALVACGSSGESSSTTASAGGESTAGSEGSSEGGSSSGEVGENGLLPGDESVLGSPEPAKGSPVVFGMINIETNQGADFPELRESVEATEKYLNEYKGGIDGHPIKVDVCVTDGSPATSASCANKLVADKPVAILGGSDIGAASAIPIYEKAGLAYIGGMNLTPAEVTSKNSVVFNDAAQSENADLGVYAVETVGAKKVAVIPIGETQGEFTAETEENVGVESAGGEVKDFPLPPTQADASSVVASALSWGPEAIILESPSQCVAILSALKSLGSTVPVLSIDTCGTQSVIDAANGAAEGLIYMSPFELLNNESENPELARAILTKYASSKILVTSAMAVGMNNLINFWSTFHETSTSKLTTEYMLGRLRAGSEHENFLAEPYTCDGKAVPAYPAICNAKQYVYEIKGGKATEIGSGYDKGASLIKYEK